ncbi:formimidoylglutamase [Virgibacillus halodenitrificans]|uniref:Formimidoylglutamase n=1 Tax=Virgibacillus halodenitrificans TaxID=1482 RepID=A0ABR7VQ10_VIRHA|nr:formimidoylglutamase [Virgibacillus halodenitrificans]MBD1223826.1 formimidoylglutamase [Virgibacillus halodenitrificans]
MYKEPEEHYWSGRIDDDINRDAFRLHQVILKRSQNEPIDFESGFTFIGFESDEGVRRNKGRIGARKAPNALRKAMASLPLQFHEEVKIEDVGNIACEGNQLEAAQAELGNAIQMLYQKGRTPIIFGGGHETLYGHYLGARKHVSHGASIGIINIDAHFDMRSEEKPTSGTMFKQILEQDKHAGYLCIGIQEFGNTKELFKTADDYNCEYILEEDVTTDNYKNTFQQIDVFTKKYDHIIVTLCTDSIIASAAPGVSAPSPFGLEPKVVRHLLRYIAAQNNVLSFDISEVNPDLDVDGRTVKLGAYLVAEVINHFHK